MNNYTPAYTITSKILALVSDITEIITEIKYTEKNLVTLKLRKKNGRIGQLWQTIILKSYREFFSFIPIESVVRDNQQKYYKALEDAGKAGESTPFVEFILDIILKSLKIFAKQYSKSNQKIIALIKKNSQITIKELCKKTKISESGVKKILKKLKGDNLLKRMGSLKGGYWKILTKK